MVDRSNLAEVNGLYDEYNALGQAIANLNAGGRITSMTIAAPNSPATATVSTAGITYPSQMNDAMRTALTQEAQAIHKELTDLGLGGLAESQWQAGPAARIRQEVASGLGRTTPR